MAYSNFDPYYDINSTAYTDEVMNVSNNVNTYQTGQNDAIDIGSSDALEFWDYEHDPNLQYSPLMIPFGSNGETSNQTGTNLGNETQEPVSLPLPLPRNATGDIDSFLGDLVPENSNRGTNNQTETNSGNEIQESLSSLPLLSSATGDIDSFLGDLVPENSNWGTNNQTETNLGNEIQESLSSLPLLSGATGDIDSFLGVPENSNWGLNNQTEMNFGNEIQEPFPFPCLTEQTGQPIVEYNAETSNQRETNLEPSRQAFSCHCCEILREIVHVQGFCIGTLAMKLQIHGRFAGVILHAVLDDIRSSEAVSREHFDLNEKSFEEVKQFLIQYCMKRKREGYVMTTDPKSSFFEILCVGFDWYDNLANEADPGGMYEAANRGNAANNNNKDKNLISLTEQRMRVKEMTLRDLKDYIHLTRKKAAQKLGLSETVINKIWSKGCAKRRWPHRKIHSKKKEIWKLEKLVADSDDPHVRLGAENELRTKKEELDKFYRDALFL